MQSTPTGIPRVSAISGVTLAREGNSCASSMAMFHPRSDRRPRWSDQAVCRSALLAVRLRPIGERAEQVCQTKSPLTKRDQERQAAIA